MVDHERFREMANRPPLMGINCKLCHTPTTGFYCIGRDAVCPACFEAEVARIHRDDTAPAADASPPGNEEVDQALSCGLTALIWFGVLFFNVAFWTAVAAVVWRFENG